jgi:hypothetical protein
MEIVQTAALEKEALEKVPPEQLSTCPISLRAMPL